MGFLALLLVCSVPLARGDLRRLAQLSLRRTWLLPTALGLQVLVITLIPGAAHWFTVGTHLLTYVLAAVFVWTNRRLPGLPLLALGAAVNAAVISLNGGTLPASAAAVEGAGLQIDPTVFTNSGVLAAPRLPWLGDVFHVPAWFPFANVFSVGDVLILLGAACTLHVTCRRPRAAGGSPDVLLQVSLAELQDEVRRAQRGLQSARDEQARLRHLCEQQPRERRDRAHWGGTGHALPLQRVA